MRPRVIALGALLMMGAGSLRPGLVGAQVVAMNRPVAGSDMVTASDTSVVPHRRFSVQLRAGTFAPSASGGIFSVAARDLSLAPSALRAGSIGAEVGFAPNPRVQLTLGVDASDRSARTRARASAAPSTVRQMTEFDLRPVLSFGARYLVRPAADTSVVATPTVLQRLAVYLSAGGGTNRYAFSQSGEFWDRETGTPFDAEYASRGPGRMGYLGLGFGWGLTARETLILETRREWASAELGGMLQSFDRINLSGMRLQIGVERRW